MKRLVSLVLALSMVASLMVGCGGTSGADASDNGTTAENAAAETEAEDELYVIYLGSKLGDNSVSDAIYEDFQKVETDFPNVKTQMIETPDDFSKYPNVVAEAVAQEPDMIFGVASNGLIDELIKAARENPDIMFMCLDAPTDQAGIDDLDNFVGMMAKQNDVSFLVGYIAGAITETDKIGIVLGLEYPVLQDFTVGYIDGAQTANPDIQVSVGIIGDFLDQAKAKEIALSQYRSGADVIYAVAGLASYGVLSAAKDEGKYSIGVDVDMAKNFIGVDDAQAEAIVTSAIKDWGYLAYNWIERIATGKADEVQWGGVEVYGIENGGVTYVQNEIFEEAVPESVQEDLNEIVEKFKSGEMTAASYFLDDGGSMSEEDYTALLDSVKFQ